MRRLSNFFCLLIFLFTASTVNAQAITSEKEGSGDFNKILYPIGGSFSPNTNLTGIIQVELPQDWSNTMLKVRIEVFNQWANTDFTANCSGYLHAAQQKWFRTSATYTGDIRNYQIIRFGHNGQKPVILLGDSTTLWRNPKVVISEVLPAHSNHEIEKWDSAWSVSVVPSLPSNIDATHNYQGGQGWLNQETNSTAISINDTIYTKGNVGIGASTKPKSTLHLFGDEKVTFGTNIVHNKASGLYFHSSDSYSIRRSLGPWSNPFQQLILDWPTGIVLDPGQGDNAGYAKSYVEITGGKGLRVTQGDVGIGTSNPQGKLHVRNSNDGSDQYSGIRLYPSDASTSGKNSYHRINGFRKNGLWIGGSANGSSYLKTNLFLTDEGFSIGMSSGTSNPETNKVMSVLNNGFVGIGTTTPDASLTVAGIIHATEFIADLNVPAPDYVFEPDYPRLSLDALRQYVTQYKHLPNIPSSDEMMESGVNLLEMNMKLLEKVEELTLYILEQEESKKNLESRLELIEKLLSTVNTSYENKN